MARLRREDWAVVHIKNTVSPKSKLRQKSKKLFTTELLKQKLKTDFVQIFTDSLTSLFFNLAEISSFKRFNFNISPSVSPKNCFYKLIMRNNTRQNAVFFQGTKKVKKTQGSWTCCRLFFISLFVGIFLQNLLKKYEINFYAIS